MNLEYPKTGKGARRDRLRFRGDRFESAIRVALPRFVEHAFVLVPAQSLVGQHLLSFQQFPPRQKLGS
jgi:hypothetical protein